MSRATSPATQKPYSLVRVCRVWHWQRSTIYRQRQSKAGPASSSVRPGPPGPCSDAELVQQIKAILAESPFYGEGYRQVWARLRHAGIRTSKRRGLRLLRENQLVVQAAHAVLPRLTRRHTWVALFLRPEAGTSWSLPQPLILQTRRSAKSPYEKPPVLQRRGKQRPCSARFSCFAVISHHGCFVFSSPRPRGERARVRGTISPNSWQIL